MNLEKVISEFAKAASSNGWDVTLGKGTSELPNEVTQRYGTIPRDYQVFLENVRSCVKDTQRTKFYCQDDYFSKDSVFLPYDGLEKMSLAAAAETDWPDIENYWDWMFTFACGLNGLNYLALSTDPKDFGVVYYGCFEDSEEAQPIADSFGEYLAELTLFHSGVKSVYTKECTIIEYDDFL